MLNRRNQEQLATEGYENFKQTLARNYFTWSIGLRTRQFRYLLRRTSPFVWPSLLRAIVTYDHRSPLTRRRQIILRVFTIMLCKFAERFDAEGLLKFMEEPATGNPSDVFVNEKRVSQDLANSILEYYAIREHFKPSMDDRATICELGAGYGRNAYVFATALPNCRYVIIDIPPALYVSQRYLSSIFAGRKIFRFRCFEDYDAVAAELEEADIAFLLPHQARLLPRKSVDLFLTISSLHEMRKEQIGAYVQLVDRLTKGYFYSKQWFVGENPYDNVTVKQSDYPVPDGWEELYLRPAKVQESFFEVMYATN
jgi:putative sugar O-methyltransferase